MKRDILIDLLRFWGISLIILAHVNPPEILFHIRSFDVPLMLFVSGMAYHSKQADFSIRFVKHRLKRLIIPVYLFLTAYFTLTTFLKYGLNIDLGITLKHIIGSYLLQDGIGFVWIIRVFLLVGLLTPFLLTIEHKIKNNLLFLSLFFLTMVLLQISISKGLGINNLFVRDYIYYAVGYALVFLIGVRIKKMSAYKAIIAMLIYLAIYLLIEKPDNFLKINNFKYPPQSIYIIYGIIMSIISYKVILRLPLIQKNSVCNFIGMNTIWIYLYHIPLIQLTGMLPNIPWWCRYIIVYVISTAICYIQIRLVNYMISFHKKLAIYKYLQG